MPVDTEISPVNTDSSSLWTAPSAEKLRKTNRPDSSSSLITPSSRSDHGTTDQERRKVAIPNLATLAVSVIRQRKPEHTVRYFSQVDMQSWTVRRSNFGAKHTDMYAVLDGTDLSISKSKNKPDGKRKRKKFVVNVRTEKVEVNVDRLEMLVYKQGRDRPLRLQIINEDTCKRWRDALNAARACDIEQFYELGNLLGSGAYGQVFEAFDVRTREKRAAKIVTRSSTNLKSMEHLSREIEIMKSISHPGIVQTYQIFDLKRKIYIVMEYVPGGDLFDFVSQHEVLTETQGSQIMKTLFGAVAYLHSHNIVHRDLKPENILCLQKSWPLNIKVTDFGFSSVLDEDSVMRTPVGTAYFMAPEIILHEGHGPPVDMWACGIILYTILTGRLPFPGRNRDEYFKSVTDAEPRFPPSLWKGISQDALFLVKGLLNKNPMKRLKALGAMNHDWIAAADQHARAVGIKRNRTNLHSSRRRLYKARSSIIAVAMAQKFKATAVVDLFEKIPAVVDKVGEGTKKVAQKTADNVMDVGDRIGEGTRKIAGNVGEGGKKVVQGVKKTGRAVEQGAQKMGEGVKKTADGIGNGAKKAAEGIGNGAKKTKESIGTGVKKTTEGFKKTGEGIKKGAEKVKIDREMLEKLKIPLDNLRPRFGGSQTGSHPDSTGTRRRDRDIFRRRNLGRGITGQSDGIRDSGPEGSLDYRTLSPVNLRSTQETEEKVEVTETATPDGTRTETVRVRSLDSEPLGVRSVESIREREDSAAEQSSGTRSIAMDFISIATQLVKPPRGAGYALNAFPEESKPFFVSDELPENPSGNTDVNAFGQVHDAIEKHSSDVSNEGSGQVAGSGEKCTSNFSNVSGGSGRPKLAPLVGLSGFSPTCDLAGDSAGSSYDMELLDDDDRGASKVRKTAAMLLATSDCSNRRIGRHKQCTAVPGSSIESP